MAISDQSKSAKPPTVLCVGIAVQDIILRVPHFPPPGGKSMATDFRVVSGGCAVNAAIAVARLGGAAHYAGPLGDMTDAVLRKSVVAALLAAVAALNACTYWHGDLERIADQGERDFRRNLVGPFAGGGSLRFFPPSSPSFHARTSPHRRSTSPPCNL